MPGEKRNPLRRLVYGYKVFLAALAGVSLAAALTLVLFLPPRPVTGAWVAEFTFWGVVLSAFLIFMEGKSPPPWFVALRRAAWIGITLVTIFGFKVGLSFSWKLLVAWVAAIILFEWSMGTGRKSKRKKR